MERTETILLRQDDREIFTIWNDDSYEVFCQPMDDYVLLTRKPKKELVEVKPYTSPTVAAVITANSRVMLWRAMYRVGQRLLYCG